MIVLLLMLGVAAASQSDAITIYEPLVDATYGSYHGVRVSDVMDGVVTVLYGGNSSSPYSLTAYVCPRGLTSLAAGGHTRRLHHDLLERQPHLAGVLTRPSSLLRSSELMRVGGWPVEDVVSPGSLRLGAMSRIAVSDLPLLVIITDDEVRSRRHLRPLADLRVTEDGVDLRCSYYSHC